ncbi:MAG: hypothetical protein D6B26_06395 [Spirochaetaceae bacterium]|mgnify:CR=1 FL=1|nr:MAG: hypothetical protein D6B26_06395 [Spirochaetaceae bacterium]
MNATTVHRTIMLLEKALQMIGAKATSQLIESTGIMINRAMRASERSFHTPEHIFALANPDDPYSILAALFHDIVYFQVDRGFDPQVGQLVEPYIEINADQVRICDKVKQDDRAFWGIASVFGFEPGMTLSPFAGLNEFLSALVMALSLEGIVADPDLLIVAASIEMTIPFRAANKNGKTPAEQLYERIIATNKQFQLGLKEQDCVNAVEKAVIFANSDVENFAEEQVARFLDNTWKLIPETNPALRTFGIFCITDYRTALMKMSGFMDNLNTDSIFASFGKQPPADQLETLRSRSQRNIKIARKYLGLKLIAATILEALAKETGNDVPVAFFMGEAERNPEGLSLANHLPAPESCQSETCQNDSKEADLFSLLAFGRSSESEFDPKSSPLSLFIYCSISEDELADSLQKARSMFSEEISRLDFLKSMPKEMITTIANAIAKVAFTRAKPLGDLVAKL